MHEEDYGERTRYMDYEQIDLYIVVVACIPADTRNYHRHFAAVHTYSIEDVEPVDNGVEAEVAEYFESVLEDSSLISQSSSSRDLFVLAECE